MEKCADIAADERNEEVAEYYRGKEVAYDETSSLIASLQQEQPEVDLEREIIRYKVPFSDDREYLNEQTLDAIARHFWNKGYNARKEK